MPEQPITHREAESLTAALRALTAELKELRTEFALTYVRQDVYHAEREADRAEVEVVRSDVAGHSTIFAWGGRLVIGAVLLALLGVVLVQNGGIPS